MKSLGARCQLPKKAQFQFFRISTIEYTASPK